MEKQPEQHPRERSRGHKTLPFPSLPLISCHDFLTGQTLYEPRNQGGSASSTVSIKFIPLKKIQNGGHWRIDLKDRK